MNPAQQEISARDGSGPPEQRPAAAHMVPAVYDRLRRLAIQWFRGRGGNGTLQPTALVHEAYLRMADRPDSAWRSRTHFYASAATAMRRILIDHARERRALKRGGGRARVALTGAQSDDHEMDVDLVALQEALDELERLNERQCRIVELRFLAGLSVEETAEALGVSPRTVKYDWRMARAWLLARLGEG